MNRSSDDDWITLAFVGVGLFMVMGASGILAALSDSTRLWLVEHHVLATDNVLIPLGHGAGLDLLRLVLIAAVIIFLVAAVIFIANARSRAREAKER